MLVRRVFSFQQSRLLYFVGTVAPALEDRSLPGDQLRQAIESRSAR